MGRWQREALTEGLSRTVSAPPPPPAAAVPLPMASPQGGSSIDEIRLSLLHPRHHRFHLVRRADDLQLLIMSATLDMALLADKLNAPVLESAGRSYPVELAYVTPENQPLAPQIARMVQQALNRHSGSVLVFLPGQSEIQQTLQLLQQQDLAADVQLHVLQGSQTLEQQQQAIAPPSAGQRKVVLSTNLAETSLTIEGISIVIDSGQCRQSRF